MNVVLRLILFNFFFVLDMLNDNFILNQSNSNQTTHFSSSPTTEVKNKRKIEDSKSQTTDGNYHF